MKLEGGDPGEFCTGSVVGDRIEWFRLGILSLPRRGLDVIAALNRCSDRVDPVGRLGKDSFNSGLRIPSWRVRNLVSGTTEMARRRQKVAG